MKRLACKKRIQSAWAMAIARISRTPILFMISCLAIMFSPCSRATVTTVVWYRLGEDDPGAGPGITATNTIDLFGTNSLPVTGPAAYSSDVSPSAAAHAASSLCLQFTNSACAIGSNVVSTLTDDFGIECWVKPVSASGSQVIAYNGNTSTRGWGLIINSSGYEALYGGIILFGAGTVTPDVWTHLALVRNAGIATLYVNGIAAGTTNSNPNTPVGSFALAAHPESPVGEYFTGGLDEVRVFTFAPGQFSTNDLLLNRREIVTTLADDGSPGSLRFLITNSLSGDTITFATNGTITLTNGEIALTNNLTIIGPGSANAVISGNNVSRVFNLSSTAQAGISGLAICNAVATSTLGGGGGGIYNAGSLALSNCVISACTALPGAGGVDSAGGAGSNGGGIYNTGTLSLTGCTLANNSAGRGGGGAGAIGPSFGFAGGLGGNAGAIYNTGNLLMSGCTLNGNSAGNGGPGGAGGLPGGAGAGPQGDGGNSGAIYNTGSATLTSCTIDSNQAGLGTVYGKVGGIYNSGVATLVASTITRNYGWNAGGGIYNAYELSARNCLFAGNTASSSPDYYGQFSSQGHNLIGNNEGSFGFFVGTDNDIVGTSNAPVDPVIAPLANNGGPTFTVALRAGSPAIDAGDDALLSIGITTDQRGLPRKSGAHVDIGAYETIVGSAPTLTALGINSNQMFGLSFTNIPYAAFTVLTSTNPALPLSDWVVVGSPIELSPGQFQFFDPSPASSAQQFYTVHSP